MADMHIPAYVGICKTCRGLNAAIVDDGTDPKDIARFLADVARRGHTIERKTVGFVRESAGENWCTCHHKPKHSEQIEIMTEAGA